MKLSTIIPVFSLALLMAACSSDEELIQGGSSSTTTNAYLSFNLSGAVQTKGDYTGSAQGDSTITSTEAINNLSLFILDNSSVVYYKASDLTLSAAKDVLLSDTIFKYQTKVKSGLSVMIVANSDVNFSGCTTASEINSKIQSANVNRLVKVGTASVDWTGITPSTGTAITATNVKTITVPLSQLTARIEVASVTFASDFKWTDNTNPKAITLKSMRILNQHTNSLTGGEKTSDTATGAFANVGTENTFTETTIYTPAANASSQPTFAPITATGNLYNYSYQNTSSTATSIELTFTVGGKDVVKTYDIAGDGKVLAGNLYRLNLVLKSFTSDDLNITLTITVLDWVKNTITVNMTESK